MRNQKRYGKIGNCEKHHDVVVKMAEAGATLDAIGRAVGTTKRRVREYLTKHNIQRPAWRNPPPGSHPMARNVGGHLNSSWKGGRMFDKSGYVLLWMPEHPEANRHGQVREHRIVMAQKLGRDLLKSEVVDHINGIKDDNRPENLRLFENNAEHLRTTLAGKCPKWSEEGKARILEANRRPKGSKRKSTHPVEEPGDPESPEQIDQKAK